MALDSVSKKKDWDSDSKNKDWDSSSKKGDWNSVSKKGDWDSTWGDKEPQSPPSLDPLDRDDPETSRDWIKSVFGSLPKSDPDNAPPVDPKLPDVAPKLPDVAPKLPDVAPKLPDVAPKLPDVAPKLPDVAPKLPDVAPKLAGVDPNLTGVGPKLPKVDPVLAGVDPKLPDVAPKLPDGEPKLAGFNLKLPDVDPNLTGVGPKLPNVDPNLVPNLDDPTAKTPLQAPLDPNSVKTPGVPPGMPPVDPRLSDNPEPVLVSPAAEFLMNYKDPTTGKTFQEMVDAEMLDDLKLHSDIQVDNKEAPDKISEYYRALLVESIYKNGLAPSNDPGKPTIPPAGTKGDLTTDDIFDHDKIAAVLDAAKTNPEIQAFLDENKRVNAGDLLRELAYSNPILKPPHDPNLVPFSEQSQYFQYIDYLKADQLKIANDPKIIAAIAKMPPEAQQNALAKIYGPIALIGNSKDQREMATTLTNNMAAATGQPKLLVDGEFNFVKTPDGKSVVIDPASGKYVAVGDDGKVITDPNTGLPPSFGIDGKAKLDAHGNPVMADKSGNEVIIEPNGIKYVFNPATNDVLQNPDSKNFISIDPNTGAAVELGADGKVVTDPATGTVKIADVRTGGPLVNSATGNFVVVDPATNAPAELNKTTGEIVTDANGNTVLVSPKTGSPVMNKTTNQPVVVDANAKLPVSIDPNTGIKTIVNPLTGDPLSDAKTTGATAILDPETNLPIAALTDKTTGNVIKDARGNIAQVDEFGRPVSVDPETGETRTIVDAQTGLDVKDANGNTLTVDQATGAVVAKDTAGKTVVEPKTGAKILYNPKTGAPIGREDGWYTALDSKTNLPVEVNVNTGTFNVDEQGRRLVIDTRTGAWLSDPNTGDPVVIDPQSNLPVSFGDGKTVVNPLTGVPVKNTAGNTVTIDPTTNRAILTGADGNPVKDPNSGGVLVVDSKTGAPLLGADKTPLQINPATGQVTTYDPVAKTFVPVEPVPTPLLDTNGNQVKDANGNVVAKDVSGNTVLLDPTGQLPISERNSGLPLIVDSTTGKVVLTPDGKSVVVDKNTGKPVAVDADGKVIADDAGNAKVYDAATGKQVVDAQGNRVVLDKDTGAPFLTDKTTGEPLVEPQSGLTYAVDSKTGALIVDKVTGNTVVLDKESKAPVLVGTDGKVVVDANGNPVMANLVNGEGAKDRNGNFVVVDKTSGLPVVVDPQTGTRTMVDGLGNPITDPASGATFEVNPKTGLPQLIKTDETGKKTVIDPNTGKAMLAFDKEVFLDQATGQMVVDTTNGMIDILTGKAPVVDDTALPKALTNDQIFKLARTAASSMYWNVYGAALALSQPSWALGAKIVAAPTPFFKATQNFHASRMVVSAQGLSSIAFAILRWAPGTPDMERFHSNDPKVREKAHLDFSYDLASIFKYNGFYPKTADGFVKYFSDPTKPFVSAGVKIAADGTVYKITEPVVYTVHAGERNPYTGEIMLKDDQFTKRYQIFLRDGEVDPLTGVKVKTTGWADVPDYRFDSKTGVTKQPIIDRGLDLDYKMVLDSEGKAIVAKWNPTTLKYEVGAPLATELQPNRYGKYVASSLTKVISNLANTSMGLGNTMGGLLQMAFGGMKLRDWNRDPMKMVSGIADLVGGLGYVAAGAAGLTGVLASTGLISATGIAATFAGMWLGPALAIGATFTLIALAIDAFSKRPDYLQWPEEFIKQFDGYIKGPKEEIQKKLEDWYWTNITHHNVNVDQISVTVY